MKLSPRYTLILVSLGILLVVIVAAVVLVVPQFTKLSELDANIGSADEQIAQSQNLLRERQQAKDNAAFTDAALLELAAAVPETPDLPSLIIELQDIAYESNVQIRVIEPADLEQGAGFVDHAADRAGLGRVRRRGRLHPAPERAHASAEAGRGEDDASRRV